MDWSKFKQCPKCGLWFSARDIIEGASVEPIGMRFHDDDSTLNLFFFNHTSDNCNTTFAIQIDLFEPFIMEPIPPAVLAGSDDCEKHCVRLEDPSECHQECRYAPFRRFLLSMVAARTKKLKESARQS